MTRVKSPLPPPRAPTRPFPSSWCWQRQGAGLRQAPKARRNLIVPTLVSRCHRRRVLSLPEASRPGQGFSWPCPSRVQGPAAARFPACSSFFHEGTAGSGAPLQKTIPRRRHGRVPPERWRGGEAGAGVCGFPRTLPPPPVSWLWRSPCSLARCKLSEFSSLASRKRQEGDGAREARRRLESSPARRLSPSGREVSPRERGQAAGVRLP